jgi:hypothetical protein
MMLNKIARITLVAGLLLACWLSAAPAQAPKGKRVEPLQTWQDYVKDGTLYKAGPANHLIANPKDWEALWKAWRGDEKVPAVDFQKELVLVVSAAGNRCSIVATLEENGNLRIQTQSTLLIAPGFGYQLGTIPRAGIKTINGKEMPAP